MLFTSEAFKSLIADKMPLDYRIIILELAGQGRTKEKFISAEIEGEKIYAYLVDEGIGEIDLAFGASLGGVVLLSLLNKKDLEIKKSIFEGCSLSQGSRFLEGFLKSIVLSKHGHALRDKSYVVYLISKIYGGDFSNILVNNFVAMDKESIKNIIHACAYVKLPVLSKEDQEKCIFCYGPKDKSLNIAKNAMGRKFNNSLMKIWKGYSHCNKIILDNERYCEFLKSQL